MSTLKRPAIHQRPRETADDLIERRRADPAGALCAHTGAIDGGLRLLTSSATRRAASAADLAPPALRPGSEDFLARPSRIGQRLHHRDGRVTDLQGNPIKTQGATP
jgi:hypothetical protein